MASEQGKKLLEEAVIMPAPEENRGAGFCWLTFLGFLFLTFNSVMAVYRSNGDRAAISFVSFSYLDLIALFYCLRRYERAPPGSPRREEARIAVCLLATMLLYAVFMVLVFWFSDTGPSGAKRGIVAPPQQHQYPPSSVPAPPWP